MMNEQQILCKKLIDAAHDGDLKTIREIVASGFDLSTLNNLGESILSAAIFELSFWNEEKPYRYEVVKLLLEFGGKSKSIR